MKPKPLPNFPSNASALLDTIVLDILHSRVSFEALEAARELDELVDADDLDFVLVLIGADESSNLEQLNLLALEELLRFLGGEA